MTRLKLNKEYFEWLCQLVYDKRYSKNLSYRKLLKYLDSVEFTYTIDMDANRAEDGTDLRYRFAFERGIEGPFVKMYLDERPCSVLEMMIALAIRCEEHLMDDPTVGNRTGQWFWNMIVNLGLGSMSDTRFDEGYVDKCVNRLLNREYGPNGEGGLFTVEHCRQDLRITEIWYQMMWYLNGIM